MSRTEPKDALAVEALQQSLIAEARPFIAPSGTIPHEGILEYRLSGPRPLL
jgi:hypothetical protein